MRLIDADEVVKFYKNMGKELPELSVGVHFSINDIINNLDNIDTVKNVNLGGKTAMTKYSDIEIKTAEALLKNGFKWITRSIYGAIIAYKIKPDKEKYSPYRVICSHFVPIFESIKFDDEPVSLENIVHPQILDDVERRYLSAVIKPFRDKVEYITKKPLVYTEYIYIHTYADNIMLPRFKEGTMYKGMKTNREYTPEELGL